MLNEKVAIRDACSLYPLIKHNLIRLLTDNSLASIIPIPYVFSPYT